MSHKIAFSTLVEKLEAILLEENTIGTCVKLIDNDELTSYITDMLVAANNAKQFLEEYESA